MRVVVSVIVPEVILMIAVPAVFAVASPVELTFATEVLEEVHSTELVMSLSDPSPNVAMAANCWVVVWARLMDGLIGVILSATSGDSLMVTVVEPIPTSYVAVNVADPAETAVATPALLTNRIDTFDEVQVHSPRTFVDPSSYVATALNCSTAPVTMEGLGGVNVIDVICELTKNPSQDVIPRTHIKTVTLLKKRESTFTAYPRVDSKKRVSLQRVQE